LFQEGQLRLPFFFVLSRSPVPTQCAGMSAPRAIFLDRDGVLIEERHYLHRVADVAFILGVFTGLQRLAAAGFQLFVVTNQSGVGRGYFTLADVEKVHEHLLAELARRGIVIRKFYVAPEAPGQPSRGRKPKPQFLFDARDEFGLDLAKSFMVGDKLIDLECGWNAGVQQSILVRTGYGRETEQNHAAQLGQAVVVDDLAAAAGWILEQN
jgi:D-glycero-D-manno-heptose 1,7-bisphosphate phosphatase